MVYDLHYNHTHTRERSRSRDRSPIFTSRPLIRRNSKRQRIDLYDDDSFDDYPHNAALTKPSRALTIREPNQLEKLNIWSAPTTTHHHHHRGRHHHHRRDSFDHDDSDHEHDHVRIRHIHRRSLSRGRSPSPSSDNSFHIQESDRDREFRLKIKAAVSIPRRANSISHSHHHSHHHHQPSSSTPTHWPGDWFRSRSREKWLQEDWESREQRRGHATNSFWPDDEEPRVERKVTFRRIKRTKTDEWKPLRNLRRFD